MIAARRGPESPGGADTAWFEGGVYEYRTTWWAPSHDGGTATLRFEGVQGDAVVTLNGVPVGEVRSGYAEQELALGDAVRWAAPNEIHVDVDHSRHPGERWYPGSGLYRPVSVVLRPPVHFAADGVRVRTRRRSHLAIVAVDARLDGDAAGAAVTATLRYEGEVVAQGSADHQSGLIELLLEEPRLWSADHPHLHDLEVVATRGDVTLDHWRERVGLREVAVSRDGLRINGVETNLRGACLHHDNGILGAATHRAAEFRRIRTLKAAGFNAVRSAHNPISRALLDACDELGMYVLDELEDTWFVRKTAYDRSARFRDTWRADADALLRKNRNRACVVMHSIGNEIPETATEAGVELSAEIAEHFRRSDPERPVTLAVNLFVNTLVSFGASPYKSGEPGRGAGEEPSLAGSTEANAMVNHIGTMMHVVSRLPRADTASRDAFATVDVAGYNYGVGRYRGDLRRHPERIILGTETLPGDVARAWKLVEEHPAVIGDFVWTGWEYLGEAGVAVWVPGRKAGLSKPYPYLIAGPGMHDLTGKPDITLRFAQAAWGELDAPAIGVRPLDRSGIPYVRSAWRTTDGVESWSWRGCEGRRAEIEVYAIEDEVELLLNGRSLGRKRAGARRGFVARYRTAYEPGELVAIGYRGGRAVSRTTLRSAAADLRLAASPEAAEIAADGADLAFVAIDIVDAAGVREMLADDEVAVEVDGPGELVGFGSAAPATKESFLDAVHSTYRGHALAIVRSTGEPGTIRIRATSRAHGAATCELRAVMTDTVTAERTRP
ncbi:MAG: glycoside hydrolase family 2 protein [Microbacteriaceae bacterium]|nr:MAG: glycoside hydrolase family 2 protein [Microbacteriaceae bacterium]